MVPDESLSYKDGKVLYITHHGVYHPKKHKIGVVFDCVTSYQGATLNEEHFQWLELTSTLIESSQDSAKNLWPCSTR